MRRQEFAVMDTNEIEQFLGEQTFGYLATNGEDGFPSIKPLNFVYIQGVVYMHGSRSGQKMNEIRRDAKATFSVASEYALIPSYWVDPTYACPATAYFKSVMFKGNLSIVEEQAEKSLAFSAFMGKLQPEGGYEPFDSQTIDYTSRLKGVAVIRLTPEHLSAKYKFGQNLKETEREALIHELRHRGGVKDEETIQLMKQYCPHHQQQKTKDS